MQFMSSRSHGHPGALKTVGFGPGGFDWRLIIGAREIGGSTSVSAAFIAKSRERTQDPERDAPSSRAAGNRDETRGGPTAAL